MLWRSFAQLPKSFNKWPLASLCIVFILIVVWLQLWNFIWRGLKFNRFFHPNTPTETIKRLIFHGSPVKDLAYPTDGGISSPLCASPILTPPHAVLTQSYRARDGGFLTMHKYNLSFWAKAQCRWRDSNLHSFGPLKIGPFALRAPLRRHRQKKHYILQTNHIDIFSDFFQFLLKPYFRNILQKLLHPRLP